MKLEATNRKALNKAVASPPLGRTLPYAVGFEGGRGPAGLGVPNFSGIEEVTIFF